MNQLERDKTREAVPALKGYAYQIWQSLFHWVTLREGEALGMVRPPSELSFARNPSEFRAALLDTCLQVVGGSLPAGREAEELYLPVGFESARVWDELGSAGAVWSHATLRAQVA